MDRPGDGIKRYSAFCAKKRATLPPPFPWLVHQKAQWLLSSADVRGAKQSGVTQKINELNVNKLLNNFAGEIIKFTMSVAFHRGRWVGFDSEGGHESSCGDKLRLMLFIATFIIVIVVLFKVNLILFNSFPFNFTYCLCFFHPHSVLPSRKEKLYHAT